MKINKNQQENASLEQRQSTKRLFLMIIIAGILMIFAFNFISAFNWNDGKIITYWDFNEGSGTTVNNRVSSIEDGTLINSPTWQGGILGTSLNYSNSSQTYVNYSGTGVGLGFTNFSNFSASFWIYPNRTQTQYIMGKASNWIIYQNGLKVSFVEWTGGGYTNSWTTTSNVLNTGRWQHIVITNNLTGVGGTAIYVNGTKKSVSTDAINGPWTNVSGAFVTGKHPDTTDTRGFYGGLDEIGIWNRTLNLSEVTELYNSGSGLAYSVSSGSISLSLLYPSNLSNFTTTTISFIVNLTPQIIAVQNTTIEIWNKTNGSLIYSETNTSGLSGNYTFSTTLSPATYNWSVYAWGNDSVRYDSEERIFEIGNLFDLAYYYSTSVVEGSSTTIIGTFNSSGSISSASLEYNNTNYSVSASSLGNHLYNLSSTATAPLVNANVNVSWRFWVNGIPSTSYNQTVLDNKIDNCSSYTNLLFNFTIVDEGNQSWLNETNAEYAVNIYNTQRSMVVATYNNSVSANPFLICLQNPVTSNYSLDTTVKYHGVIPIYTTRYYNFLNFTLANSTIPRVITLYDVNSTESLPFLLTFRGSTLALAPNILVRVDKQYLSTNDFKTVEIPKTDTNGQTILNLVRNTAIYNLIMIDIEGNVVASFSNIVAFCQDYTIGSCSIDLSASSTGQTTYDYEDDVGISSSLTYTNSTSTIALAFNSLNSSAVTVRMEVLTPNQFENRSVCDTSITLSSGTLTCDISSFLSTNQFFYVNIYQGGKLITTEYINANPNLATSGGFAGADGYFIAFFLILIIICLFSDDKQVLTIMLGIGWVVVLVFGLIRGAIIGATSGGIWLIITIIIFIWKLKQEETGN